MKWVDTEDGGRKLIPETQVERDFQTVIAERDEALSSLTEALAERDELREAARAYFALTPWAGPDKKSKAWKRLEAALGD